jgi:hypothetical protein
MTGSIKELFTQFKEVSCKNARYHLFIACAEDIVIESADISKLMSYFREADMLSALKLIKISNVTSYVLIETMRKCRSFEHRYEIFKYLLSYVSSFDSIEYKMEIIKLFGSYNVFGDDYNIFGYRFTDVWFIYHSREHYERECEYYKQAEYNYCEKLESISNSIKRIKIVKNYESNLNSSPPPLYDATNDIPYVTVQKILDYFTEITTLLTFDGEIIKPTFNEIAKTTMPRLNEIAILPAIKSVKIENITSRVLIETLSNCESLYYRYKMFTYLLSYVPTFDSLDHKMRIVKLFGDNDDILKNVTAQLKHIKIVENHEANLTSPPPYNISNSISCAPIQDKHTVSRTPEKNEGNISCTSTENKDTVSCVPIKNKDNISCTSVEIKDTITSVSVKNKDNNPCTTLQNKDNKQTSCCILL